MNKRLFLVDLVLWMLSGIYAVIVRTRNWMFDSKILRSKAFDFPIISVGNLTVGGTGKTPHTEYIVSLLSQSMKVATLSRGYKRKTSGFVLADASATGTTIGDESYQIKRKFPEVAVAVDGNRRRGISKLLANKDLQPLSAIVLDDAFQHRYVTPGLNILITDFNRLFTDDHILPYGRLREPIHSKSRANIIIVSKCPETLHPMDFRVISKKINIFPYQSLYFTTYQYGEIYPLFNSLASSQPITVADIKAEKMQVLIVTGIVSPQGIYEHIEKFTTNYDKITFSDHHNFTQKDYRSIERKFNETKNPKILLVTEKDAARIVNDNNLPEELKPSIYVLPIKVKFLSGQEPKFNQQLTTYVKENSRNIRLSKKENQPSS
ncbi:tetraacyldisaccharide 4'-kinase [Paludibacter jiangxiensis]|uniref:Tetraacyldisaccharide 4'-kinase n=1 Tax=Paludibacter jiangxiensis TaxID=681398 RepID=A0A170YFF4_9BACT|nr:tetraacyldisaccharide 4'-kinase [Paludibacter jiangxiensis]GAT61763.1 tetraacyldisaccharide 4'-kinase [Paludibacter jiangxiensis]